MAESKEVHAQASTEEKSEVAGDNSPQDTRRPSSQQGAWPQFRGPTGQGLADSPDLPLTWAENRNVSWKTPIPGRGWSSPVLLAGQLWMTTATDEGRSLRAVAVDSENGEVLHDIEVFRVSSPAAINDKNSYASPTPILEEDRVYVHFGSEGTAALDRSGQILWKTQDLDYGYSEDGIDSGSGASPVLVGSLLIIPCEGTDRQYVAALDKNTGELRWKVERKDGDQSYSTPLAVRVAGVEQVILSGGNRLSGYDPQTGDELWWVSYQGFSVVARPILGDGLLYATTGTGFGAPTLLAVALGGSGDLTDSKVAWSWRRGVPQIPSPVRVGAEIYFVNEGGILTCLDAETGEQRYRQRLHGLFSASPIAAGDRLYFFSEEGEGVIVAAGPEYRELARNELDGMIYASPAVTGTALYVRTASHLYRIQQADPAEPTE